MLPDRIGLKNPVRQWQGFRSLHPEAGSELSQVNEAKRGHFRLNSTAPAGARAKPDQFSLSLPYYYISEDLAQSLRI